MSTDSQINANQNNSQSSTGPITAEGKAIASQNSFRHGLCGAALIMLPNESIEDFMEFGNGIRAEHKPVTMTEDAIVSKIIQSLWMSARAINLQSLLLAEATHPDKERLSLYIRYQALHDRAFSKALADLKNLRSEVQQQEIGFVSQVAKQELAVAKIRSLNARSDAQESATHIRKTRYAALFSVAAAPARPLTDSRSPGKQSAA